MTASDIAMLVATNLTFVNFSVTQANGSVPDVLCDPGALAPGEQNTLGFKCTDGQYLATSGNGSDTGSSGPSGSSRSEALSLQVNLRTIWMCVAAVAITSTTIFWPVG
jgi:hypothetical protein